MVKQKFLPFKLVISKDILTSRSGLVFYIEFVRVYVIKEYTLYSDTTIIETDKREAVKSYLGVKGYRPIISIFKEVPLIIQHEFREGNAVGKVIEAVQEDKAYLTGQ